MSAAPAKVGNCRDAVTEPVIPEVGPLPVGYADLLGLVKSEVQAARVQAARVQAARLVNTELVALYWRIGTLIRQRRAEEGWGTKVVDRLAADLRAAFPGMRGFSPRNLVYMQTFAGPVGGAVAHQPVSQLPWAPACEQLWSTATGPPVPIAT